jgi:LysM repeat protein
LAALLLLPIGAIVAGAQALPAQARHVVQDGDTPERVAAEFGVDPAAILAASAVQHPPQLTTSEIILIPALSETRESVLDGMWLGIAPM